MDTGSSQYRVSSDQIKSGLPKYHNDPTTLRGNVGLQSDTDSCTTYAYPPMNEHRWLTEVNTASNLTSTATNETYTLLTSVSLGTWVEDKSFSGKPSEYVQFIYGFKETFLKWVSSAELCMDALLRSCTDEAYEAIQYCRLVQPESAVLQRALAILEEEFGNSKIVA